MMTGQLGTAQVTWGSPYISMRDIHAGGWDGGDDGHECMYDTEAFHRTVIEGRKAMARTRQEGMRVQDPVLSGRI